MLYLIGLGLGDPSDMTLKGLEIVKKCHQVYLESYTSLLVNSMANFTPDSGFTAGAGNNINDKLEELFGREVQIADREMVESGADLILTQAKDQDIAFLVVGDPFGATTHTDIVLRAKQIGVEVKVVHNASILNAISATGLQLYNFGETVSIPFWTDSWKPTSFYDKICENKKRGLHTLCLLDIKVKEPNLESMMRGKLVYEPPRFMTVSQAAGQLLQIIHDKQEQDEKSEGVIKVDEKCIGVARIGSETQEIIWQTLIDLKGIDMGQPLHSLVIPGNLHPLEEEFLNFL